MQLCTCHPIIHCLYTAACNPHCENGGTCVNGSCHCTTEWVGSSCQQGTCAIHSAMHEAVTHSYILQYIRTPCNFSAAVCFPPSGCANGGHCIAPGYCSCTTGWQGERCDEGICKCQWLLVLQLVSIVDPQLYMLNRHEYRTGPADPATTGPMFAAQCLKSQQIRSQRSSIPYTQLYTRQGVSLIAGLKWTIAIEFLCEENEAAFQCLTLCSSFFHPFPLCPTSEKFLLLQVRLLASYIWVC